MFQDILNLKATEERYLQEVKREMQVQLDKVFLRNRLKAVYYFYHSCLADYIDFQGKSVLDVGCGAGAYSILAKQLGAANVVAIDILK